MPRRATNTLFPTNEQEPDEDSGEDDFRALTPSGYALDEAVSSMQKAIRRGREREALFWGHEVWLKYPGYFWRRMMIIVSEDCAADPMTAVIIGQLARNAELATKGFKTGKIEGIIEAQAVLVASRAQKSREPADAVGTLRRAKERGFKIEPPDYAVDKHTRRGKREGKTLRDFKETGRLVAGKLGRNDYCKMRWGTDHYPPLGLPGEKGAPADIEIPAVPKGGDDEV